MARRAKTVRNLNLPRIDALTDKQDQMLTSSNNIVAHGSAGTGKTFCALSMALESVVRLKRYSHITIVRSAVETRKIGFLPGTEEEKAAVYEEPYREICTEIFSDASAYDVLKANGVIKFMTSSFLRGLNFRDSFAVIDEYQNMSFHELDTVITRMCGDCRVVFSGDTYQADLGPQSGIKEFNKILMDMDEFDFIDFTLDDVVRGPLVKSYLKAKYAREK